MSERPGHHNSVALAVVVAAVLRMERAPYLRRSLIRAVTFPNCNQSFPPQAFRRSTSRASAGSHLGRGVERVASTAAVALVNQWDPSGRLSIDLTELQLALCQSLIPIEAEEYRHDDEGDNGDGTCSELLILIGWWQSNGYRFILLHCRSEHHALIAECSGWLRYQLQMTAQKARP